MFVYHTFVYAVFIYADTVIVFLTRWFSVVEFLMCMCVLFILWLRYGVIDYTSASEMTYIVSSGALNSTQSLTHSIDYTITTNNPVRVNYSLKSHKYLCITTSQPYYPNPNDNSHPTTEQHAIVNIQLNIVTCPTHPDKFIRDLLLHRVYYFRL